MKDATDEKEKNLVRKQIQDLFRRESTAKDAIEKLKWPARRALILRGVQGAAVWIITLPARIPTIFIPPWEYLDPKNAPIDA